MCKGFDQDICDVLPTLEVFDQRSNDALAIAFRPDFYEVDYIPEIDRLRYIIGKELLKRLIQLNLTYTEEEAKGLQKKMPVKKAEDGGDAASAVRQVNLGEN